MCYIELASNEKIDKNRKKIGYGVWRYWCGGVLSGGPDGWSWKSSMTVLVKADLCSIGPWLCLCEVLSSVSLCLLCSVSVYLVSPVCEIGNVKPSFPKIAKQLSETLLLPTYADSQHVASYSHISHMHIFTNTDASSDNCIHSWAVFGKVTFK